MNTQFEWDDQKKEWFGSSVLARQPDEKDRIMKNTSTSNDAPREENMKDEYRLDYKKARSNRFAPAIAEGSRVVVLDPDIAKVFTSPESVNAVLRALIATMPKTDIDDKAAWHAH